MSESLTPYEISKLPQDVVRADEEMGAQSDQVRRLKTDQGLTNQVVNMVRQRRSMLCICGEFTIVHLQHCTLSCTS